MSDCYRVPSKVISSRRPAAVDDPNSSADETEPTRAETQAPLMPPAIPSEISTPTSQETSVQNSLPSTSNECSCLLEQNLRSP